MVMASLISSTTCLCLCSSSTNTKSSLNAFSSLFPISKASNFEHYPWLSQLGSSVFSPYSGLKHMGIPISSIYHKAERKRRRCRGRVVHASLFGVGAPEALVIGVVALLVFGPKGLAEVARNLGKTLRAFQPTIRELQDVSREFKSSLEREIGLDDIPLQNTYSSNRTTTNPVSTASPPEDPVNITNPNGPLSSPAAYSSEEYLKITEEQLKASSTPAQAETQAQILEKENESIIQPSGQTSPGDSKP